MHYPLMDVVRPADVGQPELNHASVVYATVHFRQQFGHIVRAAYDGDVTGESALREEDRTAAAAAVARRLAGNVETVVHGKPDQVRLVVAALAAGGHVLFEDVPGTAKTILARAVAGSVEDLAFSRIQCTPDLQPTDVTGLSIFDAASRTFQFRPGPVFANVLLVDEINRAMPKTQSALLEAMAEAQVTVEGVTHAEPSPFLVLATQNPIDQEGTFPLPEAQLDRFAVRTALGYPSLEEELQVVSEQRGGHPLEQLRPVASLDEVRDLQRAIEDVYVDPLLLEWLVGLVRATRELESVAVGASVRASLALERVARAWALVHGRVHVEPEDVERLFVPVVGHRLIFDPFAVAEAASGTEALLEEVRAAVLARVPRPEPDWDQQPAP
jgi:MoxR-like ATPase